MNMLEYIVRYWEAFSRAAEKVRVSKMVNDSTEANNIPRKSLTTMEVYNYDHLKLRKIYENWDVVISSGN